MGFDPKAARDSTLGVLACVGLIASIIGATWVVDRYEWRGLAGLVIAGGVIWLWVANYEEHKRINRARAERENRERANQQVQP